MSYGVNTWVGQRGRARAAGSSKRKSTRTGKRKRSGSARHVKKSKKRRSLPLAAKSKIDPRDYHALPIGKAPRGWGGSQAEWFLYSQGKGPGKWL